MAVIIGIIFILTQVTLFTCDPVRNAKAVSGCLTNEWTCDNGHCIWSAQKCDGKNDCGDNSDETNGCLDLSNSCGTGRMMCRSVMKCVSNSDKCNGVNDCGDNSDEDHCPHLHSLCQKGNPLVDEHGVQYFCGLGPTSQRCPPNSFCHVAPTDEFAVCCHL